MNAVYDNEAKKDWWEDLPHFPRKQYSKEDRNYILSLGNNRCARCGGKKDLQIDHVIPVRDGGTDELQNLQILCRSCNIIKGHRARRYGNVLKPGPSETEIIVKKRSQTDPLYTAKRCGRCKQFPGEGKPCKSNTNLSRLVYKSNYSCMNYRG